MIIKLEKPTNELIDKFIEKFNNDKRYYTADQSILNLFTAFPKNNKLEDILLKVSVINNLYNTNILGTFKMAKHIQSLNIDECLKVGNPSVVNKIATGHDIKTKKNNKELNFYSFATKYCNWHNINCYAIYDSFVEKVLIAYKKQDKFSTFVQSDLKDFKKFKKIIIDFLNYYRLSKYNLKEIDKFLWIYGKENFSIFYNKKGIKYIEKQYCPICNTETTKHSRYPNYVCLKCQSKATDKNGRKLLFGNVDISGGFEAIYEDTKEKYDSHICYIEEIECYANEAYFGGIVIEKR